MHKCLTMMLLLAALASPLPGEVVIGVLIDGPWERNDEITHTFEQEILGLTGREFDVTMPAEKQIVGGWTVASVTGGLDRLLADSEVDLVITAGVLGSNEAGHRTSFSKPVIAGWSRAQRDPSPRLRMIYCLVHSTGNARL